MHSLKSEFHEVFEDSKYLGVGTLKLINWLNKAQPYQTNSVATIKRQFAEVAGYFESRITNGRVEGINKKLKLLKGGRLGFKNFNNFQIRALLVWHNANILAHLSTEEPFKSYLPTFLLSIQQRKQLLRINLAVRIASSTALNLLCFPQALNLKTSITLPPVFYVTSSDIRLTMT